MADHERWMRRCLELARLGANSAAPNPMVGAVLVQGDRVLAEGWHKAAGGPHAEVECLRAFRDGPVPADTILYVNLEPCDHHGRTPPCSLLLIERGLKRVVIAHRDPFPSVAGRGVERLRAAGVEVMEDVLKEEARWLNRRFLTSIAKGRPYVVLKWAMSADGFLDQQPKTLREVQRISSPTTDALVHRWRSEEQAIMVGSRTVLNDDPQLNVRHVQGPSPLRIVLDRHGRAPAGSKLFTDGHPTLLFTFAQRKGLKAEQVLLDPKEDPIDRVLSELHSRSIRSVFIEGGAELHGHFLERSLWDEARVITGRVTFGSGTKAPVLTGRPIRSFNSDGDAVQFHVNGSTSTAGEWPW